DPPEPRATHRRHGPNRAHRGGVVRSRGALARLDRTHPDGHRAAPVRRRPPVPRQAGRLGFVLKDVEFLTVDAVPIDGELQDAGNTGPELAQLAATYRNSPRAIVFRNPSSDWRLFVVLLPLASRLSLMTNPIFTQLTRAWGLNVRFVGVDRDHLVYDFRALLSDRTLRLLVDVLARSELAPGVSRRGDDALDVLFASLADEMLTTLDRRRDDWGRHLDREHRLEPGAPASLFDRAGRYPDFLAALRRALRDEIIDVDFYGRVLRSIDLREDAIDARVRAVLESALDPIT